MAINALNEIKERYNTFKEIFQILRKSSNVNISKDKIDKIEDTIEDLFIVEIFGFLECFLKDEIKKCIEQDKCFIYNKIRERIDHMGIGDLLGSLRLENKSKSYLGQMKSYRNWVAHGKYQGKSPSFQKANYDNYFDVVEIIIQYINAKKGGKYMMCKKGTKVGTGSPAPCSGLIECTKCGKEIVIEKSKTIPPCQDCGNSEWKYVKVTDPGK